MSLSFDEEPVPSWRYEVPGGGGTVAESLVSAADLLIKLFEANVPTCLAHAVTLSKKFDVALVQTSESDGVTSVYLAWLLRHGYVAYAQRMILERKVGLKPWATAGARPGLRTLEAATDLFPTNKDLLLCILRNLPTSTDEASEQRDGHTISFYGAVDELRARAILQRLVKRKADMLVCITFVSLWKVMFSHIDRRKNEDDDKKPWGGMLMYRILSRIDLSFQERHPTRRSLRSGQWRVGAMGAGSSQAEKDQILEWRFDVVAGAGSGRPGNRLAVVRPPANEPNADHNIRKAQQIGYGDPLDSTLDVTEFEIQRDVERGRDPAEARASAEQHRATVAAAVAAAKADGSFSSYNRPEFSMPWGQKERLRFPEDLHVSENRYEVSTFKPMARWALQHQIFQPQTTEELRNSRTCHYLMHAPSWFSSSSSPLQSQQDVDDLKCEFPQYITDELLGVGSRAHVNWLASRGMLDEMRQHLSSCSQWALRQLFESEHGGHSEDLQTRARVHDFLLEMLYERPELIDHEGGLMSLGAELQVSGSPVLVFLWYVLGGGCISAYPHGCSTFVDGHRLASQQKRYHCAMPMEMEERWAMVQVLSAQMGQVGGDGWYTSLLDALDTKEINFWLEWSQNRFIAVRSPYTSTRSAYCSKFNYRPWLRAHNFAAPHIAEWLEMRHLPLVELLAEVDQLWPLAYRQQSVQRDFVLLALHSRNKQLLHHLEKDRGLALFPANVMAALGSFARPEHAAKSRENYCAWIDPALEEAHFSMLHWFFTTHADVITSYYVKATVGPYGGSAQYDFDPHKDEAQLDPVQRTTYEWVQANCPAVRDYLCRCVDAKAQQQREQEARAEQRRLQQEQEQQRRARGDYDDDDYDDYGYGYDD